LLRRDDSDVRKTSEVSGIEGEEVPQAVSAHGGYEAGVMSCFALDIMYVNDLLSFGEDAAFIEKQDKKPLDLAKLFHGFARRHSQPILIDGSGGDHPELVKALRNNEYFFIVLEEESDGVPGTGVLGMLRLGQPGKDVGVEEHTHSPRPS
jgi:hypothetical protein